MISMTTAGLIAIKNKKLLLAFSRNKQAWYLPGGKIDEGESTRAGLIREIREELGIDILENDLGYYTHISAQAFGEKQNTIMEQDCFICEINHSPQPSAEIQALNYFDTAAYAKEPAQVPGVVIVMEKLKSDQLID